MTTLKISNCIVTKDQDVNGIVFNVFTNTGEYLFSFDENLNEFQNILCILKKNNETAK